MATTTAIRTIQVALNDANPSDLADALGEASLGQLMDDLSSATEETLTAASAALTLSKLPVGPVAVINSSDAAFGQTQKAAPAASTFSVNYSTAVVTLPAGSSGDFKCVYLGITKSSEGGSDLSSSLSKKLGS